MARSTFGVVIPLICLLSAACGEEGPPPAGAGFVGAGPGAGADASPGPAPDVSGPPPGAPDTRPPGPDAPPLARPEAGPTDPPDGPQAGITVAEGPQVVPQTVLHLQGPTAADIVRYEWSVAQPEGSQSRFVPSETVAAPTFEANVAGRYTFTLRVWDDQGRESAQPALYAVEAVPDRAIHVELLWHTPGDPDESDYGPWAGSDMDLHFVHPAAPSDPAAPDLDGDGAPDPYFDHPFDCYWFNPHPDWASSDPALDRDDTDGAGPENINLAVPEAGARYRIAVHYWNDHAYGPSFATVRVYLDGALVWEDADVRLNNYDLWCVALLDWASGTIEPCTEPDGHHRITPAYRPPLFFEEDPCGDACVPPYPGCVVINGVPACVPCSLPWHCPGGRCNVERYECEAVCRDDCRQAGCPSPRLQCYRETGCCENPLGLCDDVAAFCRSDTGSECRSVFDIFQAGALPGGGVPGVGPYTAGLCTCDVALAMLCVLEPDNPACGEVPLCPEGAQCVPLTTLVERFRAAGDGDPGGAPLLTGDFCVPAPE